MLALAIIGWSGSGKTTLIERLIPHLRARGMKVSTIKHAHHRLALDQPGKDSARHAAAGAEEVILANETEFALFARRPATLAELLARLAPVDLVLVEGYKAENLPRLEVHRPALNKPPLWPETPVCAVATDAVITTPNVPVLDLAATEAIADFIIALFALDRTTRGRE